MATNERRSENGPRPEFVRRAAAKAAVAASKNTGRPVDPRVAELARDDSADSAVGARFEGERPRSPWNRFWRRRTKT
jgi:hypothetical protein